MGGIDSVQQKMLVFKIGRFESIFIAHHQKRWSGKGWLYIHIKSFIGWYGRQ